MSSVKRRFGDFAEMVNDRVDNPASSGLSRYVGLEHLDPGVIRIVRTGSTDDVGSTKFRFRSGDVIYARRNPHLRKAGLADFDGIASAHSLVLRAVPTVCTPEYLANFLISSTFSKRAMAISVGSLSRTINWPDLRTQEFDLPPLDEQLRIVEVMRAVDREIEAATFVLDLIRTTIASLVDSQTDATAPRQLLKGILAARTSGAWGVGESDESRPIKVRVITNGDIRPDGTIGGHSTRWYSAREVSRFVLKSGDTLMAASGATIGRTARILPELISEAVEPLAFSNFVHLLRPGDAIGPNYLYAQARYGSIQHDIERLSSGSTLANLNVDFYERAKIRVPQAEDMVRLEGEISALLHTEGAARQTISGSLLLRTSLLQELIG